MNKKHVSENAGGTPQAWGWEQPQCRGQAALALFIDDLHRILQNYTAGRLAASGSLADAQEQVDQLLARYNEIAAAPEIFLGQSVQLKEGVDRSGVSHTVPIFSARLKQSLVAMLGQRPG
ncbi:hypothetical protein SB816_24530 [Achromobacter sp. SIMBA_011]|jgi:hypothetical protein|uniref:Uncharacterized protein n=1 Tax=Achromobacter dolens TaxID=1287738 RepID=A0A6S7ELM6_9BURK|nr:hypothetical protein [Achromobacter dolens]MBQ2646601.1 hypothetical protein [Achromobacter sp.]OAS90526.1 hypothetical protein A6I77_06220 [Achromobacter xylosoxidans]MCZ8411136.1 hypothetical protein [Achromobacter dolens]CAB3632607.1 hypothetical protein LMG26840_01066 [Achromobacter dolens]CAB3813114.1 hypothetical protein LMG26842_00779 [Achromobacter dolens]